MNYRDFVKSNFHKLPASMAAKDKMKKIGEMWRASGHSKGGSVAGGAMKKRVMKAKAGDVEGGGILSGLLGSIGLGVEPKKSMKAKAGSVAGGAMKKRVKKAKAGSVAGGDVEGSGMLSSLLGAVGLGVDKPKKMKAKAGSVSGGDMNSFFFNHMPMGHLFQTALNMLHNIKATGGDVEGGSFLSTLFPIHGLFGGVGGAVMDKKKKVKLYNKMNKLEMASHKKKLPKKQHDMLKALHVAHGAGFFDDLWSGVKNVGSTALELAPHILPMVL